MNSDSDCTPVYMLFVDDGTGSYVAYSDLNGSYDIISLDTSTNPVSLKITTSTADDGYLIEEIWSLRVTVASVSDLAYSPLYP